MIKFILITLLAEIQVYIKSVVQRTVGSDLRTRPGVFFQLSLKSSSLSIQLYIVPIKNMTEHVREILTQVI